MNTKQLIFIVGCFALAATTTVADRSYAGYAYPGNATCSKNGDGSGSCSGTFNGFRIASGMYDYVDFSVTAYSSGPAYPYFGANLGGVWYACSGNTALLPAWQAMIASRAAFTINWDSTGKCTYLHYENGSQVVMY